MNPLSASWRAAVTWSSGRRTRPVVAVHVVLTAAVLAAVATDSVYMPTQAEATRGTPPASVARPKPVHKRLPLDAGVRPHGRPVAEHVAEKPIEAVPMSLDTRLAEAVGPVARSGEGRLSVAVMDLQTGESAVYGEDHFDTASIVKVDILAALLLQAQDAGRRLTDQEQDQATAMIEWSDNAAASALWRAIGGDDGLDSANERLGLHSTSAGEYDRWGLTQTTARDQLELLRAIYELDDSGQGSVLEEESRSFVRYLMNHVVPDQDWGISAAADGRSDEDSSADGPPTGGRYGLKNGWLPRSTTNRWDINSIGEVEADGRSYLLSVLSDGWPTKGAGVSAVEDAARAAVAALSPSPAGL